MILNKDRYTCVMGPAVRHARLRFITQGLKHGSRSPILGYREREMYQEQTKQLGFDEFYFPFEGNIDRSNRWVIMSDAVPWDELEEKYRAHFSAKAKGAHAKPFRMALGALIIKAKLHISDREVVDQITENHYMQYFIGLEAYRGVPPFDASMMVHFRRRVGDEILQEALHRIAMSARDHAGTGV